MSEKRVARIFTAGAARAVCVRSERKPLSMANTLFISSIFLVVLVIPGFSQKVTVCKEEDGDVRVDCLIAPKQNQINSYEFSITKGSKEVVINTNVTGKTADPKFKDTTQVDSLDLQGYRLRMRKYQMDENTTFICKATQTTESVMVVKGKMLECSAISLFLHSCPWLVASLLLLHVGQSWALSSAL
ncbi:hypothetical protein ANANG_G00164310 [Anguilla anguilla]|uniref:Uncharacterized protein n=1 Tax=Anguilla anguilla TaxID=7936 RepID=A0A9D3M8X7_ANGAN|nr:hypothetical protein ANANG_G00164310 [Anguilla anguilla]